MNMTKNIRMMQVFHVFENISCIMAITPSTVRMFLYMFIGSVICFVTVTGNLLVIISIIYFKQLHTPTNYLILSLAMADLLVGAVALFFNMAVSVESCSFLGDLTCKMRRSFDISLMTASILNLCCISIDRYYAVCKPLTYRAKINGQIVLIMILITWSVSALSGFGIMFIGFKNYVCEDRCFIFNMPNSNFAGSVFSFYLPVIIMLCIYMKIFFAAQRQARSIQIMKSRATFSKKESKATKTLATVMGVFLFCWSPFFLSVTLNPVVDYKVPSSLSETFIWLGWSNSMLNPFVYGFFYSWFRAAVKIIISGQIFKGNFTNSKLC